MLSELRATNLGVIEDLSLSLSSGMTAVTGETGAGKTLLVTALSLLVGAKSDARLVRTGADEAAVEGRFCPDRQNEPDSENEIVLRRVVTSAGRSRCYVNGSMVPLAALAEQGARLVDVHGQHVHQRLLRPSTQRDALDAFAEIDLEPLIASRRAIKDIDSQLATLGGDVHTRARELDLLDYQLAELGAARLVDAAEDERLQAEETLLGDAEHLRLALSGAYGDLQNDGQALDWLRQALSKLNSAEHLYPLAERLRALIADVDDAASEINAATSAISDDPEQLANVQQRRTLLSDLRRKYGDTLAEVMDFHAKAQRRHDELTAAAGTVARLESQRAGVVISLQTLEVQVGAARRQAARKLGRAVQDRLGDLALPGARFEVQVGAVEPGDDVEFLFQANVGATPAPLSAIASGGELARTMLALRLVLGEAGEQPDTAVFDEADAGIGGQAAVAVGHALATLGRKRQILVVTHLPQVAAFASSHVVVEKRFGTDSTVAEVFAVTEGERVIELSRMLSGMPESESGRRHAEDLLADAQSAVTS